MTKWWCAVGRGGSGLLLCEARLTKVLKSMPCRRPCVPPRLSPPAAPVGERCASPDAPSPKLCCRSKCRRELPLSKPLEVHKSSSAVVTCHPCTKKGHSSGVARTRGRASIATAAFIVFNMHSDDPCARKLLARNYVAHSHKCSLLHYKSCAGGPWVLV